MEARQAFLFDVDGTLVDSVYQHVLVWRDSLDRMGMELSVWRIHRGSGGDPADLLRHLDEVGVRLEAPTERTMRVIGNG